MTSVYRLVIHAGHYGDATKKNGGGHDLDEWDIAADVAPTSRTAGLPDGAKFHHGYRDDKGEQHWVFTRLAPFSNERCDRCPASPSEGGTGAKGTR